MPETVEGQHNDASGHDLSERLANGRFLKCASIMSLNSAWLALSKSTAKRRITCISHAKTTSIDQLS